MTCYRFSHLLVIDSAIEDKKTLIKGAVSGIEILVLDAKRDGVEQISERLSISRNITTIHIVSHGAPGCLYLGNSQLSLSTLNHYATQLKSWFTTGDNPPSFLLYGCNVAAGDAGEQFIAQLAQLTGANLAASAQKVGNRAKGGTWQLETWNLALGDADW